MKVKLDSVCAANHSLFSIWHESVGERFSLNQKAILTILMLHEDMLFYENNKRQQLWFSYEEATCEHVLRSLKSIGITKEQLISQIGLFIKDGIISSKIKRNKLFLHVDWQQIWNGGPAEPEKTPNLDKIAFL